MQKLKSVAALGEELGPDIVKWETTIFRKSCFSAGKACSTRFPGGNLVDGLPPVASTGEVCLALRAPTNKCMAERPSILIFSRCDYTIWTGPVFHIEELYKLSEFPSFIQFHTLEQKLLRTSVSKSCSFLHNFHNMF